MTTTLSVVVSRRADHTPQTTVVNAGVLPQPVTRDHLRADPATAVVVRAGWQWTAVEGRTQLIGPHDPISHRTLLRPFLSGVVRDPLGEPPDSRDWVTEGMPSL